MPDDLRPILDPLKVSDDVKADVWDAYHAASSQADFKARFDKLAIPDEVKADLWDRKFSQASTPATPATPPARLSSTMN